VLVHKFSENRGVVGIYIQRRLKACNYVFVDLIKIFFDEFICSFTILKPGVAEWALQQLLAVQADVIKLAWLRGQIMAEEAIRFVAITCQIKLADFLQDFDLKIVTVRTLFTSATMPSLIKLTALNFIVLASETKGASLWKLLILPSGSLFFLLNVFCDFIPLALCRILSIFRL
jgi:hypothetical protein